MATKKLGRPTPKILVDRRKGMPGKIWKRDFSENPVGQLFTKKPEAMDYCRFSEKGEQMRQKAMKAELLRKRVNGLMKLRMDPEVYMHFLKGRSGTYYLIFRSHYAPKYLYFSVTNPEILEAIKFLFQ